LRERKRESWQRIRIRKREGEWERGSKAIRVNENNEDKKNAERKGGRDKQR
jgi:hypothetical protein